MGTTVGTCAFSITGTRSMQGYQAKVLLAPLTGVFQIYDMELVGLSQLANLP